jgi:hypothetical protein
MSRLPTEHSPNAFGQNALTRNELARSLWHSYPDGIAKADKGEKLVQEQMLALLEWAADRPKSWHPIGTLPETQRAAELLASRGVIEFRKAENQYRIKR